MTKNFGEKDKLNSYIYTLAPTRRRQKLMAGQVHTHQVPAFFPRAKWQNPHGPCFLIVKYADGNVKFLH